MYTIIIFDFQQFLNKLQKNFANPQYTCEKAKQTARQGFKEIIAFNLSVLFLCFKRRRGG